MEKTIIKTGKAPQAIGPYSVAVRFGNLIFTAGQLGIDPDTNEIVSGGIEAETRQALTNIKNILESSCSSMEKVLKVTVFLREMADFTAMNTIYGEFFKKDYPSRTTVQIAALPKNAMIEIEAIAMV